MDLIQNNFNLICSHIMSLISVLIVSSHVCLTAEEASFSVITKNTLTYSKNCGRLFMEKTVQILQY
jgi:hypothetical protein